MNLTSKSKKELLKQKMDKFLETISKLGSQKHLSALRDAFALGIPITIAGAIAIFFITIVFGGWGANKTSLLGLLAHAGGGTSVSLSNLTNDASTWTLTGNWLVLQKYGMTLFGWINSATLGMMSIYMALLVSYSMGVIRRAKSPILVAITGLAAFLVLIAFKNQMFSAQGMFVSIVAGIGASEFFIWLTKSGKLELKLPPSVPPAVGRSFGILIPAFLTILFAGLVNVVVSLPFIWMDTWGTGTAKHKLIDLSYVLTTFVQAPFISIAKSGADTPILFVYVFGVSFLWIFGIHGSNTLNGIFMPIATLLWIDNLSGGRNVFTGGVFNCFAFIGGTGSTLPLIVLSIFLLPNGSPTREVAKFSVPVGVFEVNEPVLFGYPIVFSPKWVIPFIGGPLLGLIWPVIAIRGGWMNPEIIPVPWTTPPILNALIATQFDWRSIIVSLLTIATISLTYLPFVLWQRKEDKILVNKEKEVAYESI